MCIIIYRPAGAKSRLSRETLNHCADENPHGFGLMWSNGGKLCTARYLPAERKTFINRTLALQESNVPFCAHFRWATHGANVRENTHPFVIRKGHSALMHNGIISVPTPAGWSDTRSFVNNVIAYLNEGWEKEPYDRWMVEQACVGSKLAVMHADGTVYLIHEKAGVWDNGIWYSNSGYRKHESRRQWADTAAAMEARWFKGDRRSAHQTSAKPFQMHFPLQSEPVEKVEKLYLFEGMILCESCLRMETSAKDRATLLREPLTGECCDLCDSLTAQEVN